MSTPIEIHSNNLVAMGEALDNLIQDHQRLTKDSTHELAHGIQLYMQAFTAFQKTILSFEGVKKEMSNAKQEENT